MLSENTALHRRLQTQLDQRAEAGQLRALKAYQGIDFASNDYLGLAKSPSLPLDERALARGATGSRLISGDYADTRSLESELSDFHGFEKSLLFSSGYSANLGLLASLGARGDVMFLDALAHASLIDGARLSHAKRQRFAHNDVEDLRKKLAEFSAQSSDSDKQAFVVVESVYSMDGDIALLPELAEVCREYEANLIVDEAHAVGIYGQEGAGLLDKLELQQEVFAAVVTFGKAMGCHGAIVAGSKVLQQYLINYCRPFIYTTAPSLQTVAVIAAAHRDMRAANTQRNQLTQNIDYFKQRLKPLQLKAAHWLDSDTPIQGLVIGDSVRAKTLESALNDDGFFVKAILSPTVKAGTERLRLCLHSDNTTEQLQRLAERLVHHLGVEQ